MIEVQRENTNFNIKILILVWLTFQNSAHNLLIRYSRARDVQDMFFSTSAVFNTEIIKLIICLYMVLYETGSFKGLIRQINAQVIKQPFDTLKVCVPAMIYIVQNNLFYLAASHLDAASFMITSQLKIFTTALFSVTMLRKSLLKTQWIALFILFIGVSLVQMQTGKTGGIDPKQKPFIGSLAVVGACCLSGFAGVYFEKILKGSAPVSIWMRNVQMAIFAIPASFIGMFTQDGSSIMEKGIYYGYDFVVWLTVFWYGVGGLSVAVCIKYADNIAKNFATSVSIILSTVGSMYFFSFIPNTLFSLGAGLVILSIFLYSSTNMFVKLLKKQTIV
uniref:UDP-galactose translocator n=1 Tax=Strongyloides papillosus TaxID=174720 RepID=A0A0N5CDM2_STREA